MTELCVPELVENPFRELYRELIVTSMLRSVEEQEAHYRARHQQRRAARCERAAAQLGAVVADVPGKTVVPAAAPFLEAAPVVEAPPAVEPLPLAEAVPAPVITPVRVRLEPPVAVAAPAPVVEAKRPGVAQPPVLPMIVDGEPWFGAGARRAAAAVWALTLAVLVCNTVVFGFRSWATGAADLALVTLTLVWFAVADTGRSPRF
jgi:hypothetical protein